MPDLHGASRPVKLPMKPMTSQDPRSSKANMVVLVGVMAVVTLVIAVLLMRQGDDQEAPVSNPFAGVRPESDKPTSLVPESQRPGESHMMGVEGGGAGQAPSVVVGAGLEKMVGVGDVAPAQGGKPTGGPKKKEPKDETARDMAFLSKHSQLIAAEDKRLRGITKKYHNKKYPIVDEVSRYFGRMPNYMKLLREYRSKNPFELLRKSVALPEVRDGVKKFAARPEAMSVGVRMVAEAVGGKPPKPLMDEAMRFLNEDDTVGSFMHRDFWPQVLPRLPGAMIATPMDPETRKDMDTLASTLTGVPMAGAPNITGQPRKTR